MARPYPHCALCPRLWPLLIAAALIAAAAMLPACSKQREPASPASTPLQPSAIQASATTPPAADPDPVARGKYLVTVGGCNDCHTPWKLGKNGPEPDYSRLLSGHPANLKLTPPAAAADPKTGWAWAGAITNTAFHGPWGTSFTANLTPDEDSGIGIWTEKMFIDTLRSGRHWTSGRPIMPPMPWFNYAKLTDEDLKSIYAYLRTIPPVRNRVPEWMPPAKDVAKAPAGEGQTESAATTPQ